MYDYDIHIRTYGETTNISIKKRYGDERTTLTAARGCTKSFINWLLKKLDEMVDKMEETESYDMLVDEIAAEHREDEKQSCGIYEKSDAMETIYSLDKHQAAEFVALLSAEVERYGKIDKIAILNSLKKVRGKGLYD